MAPIKNDTLRISGGLAGRVGGGVREGGGAAQKPRAAGAKASGRAKVAAGGARARVGVAAGAGGRVSAGLEAGLSARVSAGVEGGMSGRVGGGAREGGGRAAPTNGLSIGAGIGADVFEVSGGVSAQVQPQTWGEWLTEKKDQLIEAITPQPVKDIQETYEMSNEMEERIKTMKKGDTFTIDSNLEGNAPVKKATIKLAGNQKVEVKSEGDGTYTVSIDRNGSLGVGAGIKGADMAEGSVNGKGVTRIEYTARSPEEAMKIVEEMQKVQANNPTPGVPAEWNEMRDNALLNDRLKAVEFGGGANVKIAVEPGKKSGASVLKAGGIETEGEVLTRVRVEFEKDENGKMTVKASKTESAKLAGKGSLKLSVGQENGPGIGLPQGSASSESTVSVTRTYELKNKSREEIMADPLAALNEARSNGSTEVKVEQKVEAERTGRSSKSGTVSVNVKIADDKLTGERMKKIVRGDREELKQLGNDAEVSVQKEIATSEKRRVGLDLIVINGSYEVSQTQRETTEIYSNRRREIRP